MPYFLALEWNGDEIRVAAAGGRGNRVVVEHAFSIPLVEESPGDEPLEQRIGRRIAEALDARGIERAPALVAVGRGSIELRRLLLPPAPDDELPDMVRFQAAREFNEFDDRWLLDFVPIDRGADGSRTVLATAVAPTVVQHIESVCDSAGLKMFRILLRPCAAASLAAEGRPSSPGTMRLLIDPLSDEVDLTVFGDGRAVFLRSMRFSGAAPPPAALLAEIRLTIAAAQNQLAGCKVESLVLCGHGPARDAMAQILREELDWPVELFDPFESVEASASLRAALPENPGRFAPLLGMLLAECRGTGHAIDFLHPRRRAEPPNRRKRWLLAGAAAALAVLIPLGYIRVENYRLSSEIERLSGEIKALDRRIAAAKKTRAAVAEIAKWADDDTVWLDQLLALSEGFPPAQDAILGQLTFSIRSTGGQVDVKGWVRDSEVIARMEQRVRERAAHITGKSSRADASRKGYSWAFEATVHPARGAALSGTRTTPAKQEKP